MQLPYDPEDPPVEPPAGSDRLMWRLAHTLHRDHQPDAHGWCIICRPSVLWPCDPSRLAATGMMGAVLLNPPSRRPAPQQRSPRYGLPGLPGPPQ